MIHSVPFWELSLLYKLMVDKLHEAYASKYPGTPIPQSVLDISRFNTGTVKGFPLSLTDLINDSPDVQAHLHRYQASLRYKRNFRRARVSEAVIRDIGNAIENNIQAPFILKKKYAEVFYVFLGSKNRDGFIQQYCERVAFKGYYYSVLGYEVREFNFTIIYPKHKQQLENIAIVEQSGFHDACKEELFVGNLSRFGQVWTVRLQNAQYFIDISIHSGNAKGKIGELVDSNFLFGTISGTGSDHYLLCVECILVNNRVDDKKAINARRLLHLNRNLFGVELEYRILMDKLDELRIDGHKVVKIEDLAGNIFRVFTLAPNGAIVQSRFEIRKDYSAGISIPDVAGNEQLTCQLSFTNISENRLIIYVYYDSRVLYSVTVIEVPRQKFDKSRPVILHGAFCQCEQEIHEVPIGNMLVMAVDNDSDFEARTYQKDEMAALLENPIAKNLYEAL